MLKCLSFVKVRTINLFLQVTLVVNYDLPEMNGEADCETYLHRIGRTGRFGKTGNAINIVDGEKAHKLLKQIEKHFGKVFSLSLSLLHVISYRRVFITWEQPSQSRICDLRSGRKVAILIL